MSSGFSHNQYIYGTYARHKKYNIELHLLEGCLAELYAKDVALDEFCCPVFYYKNKIQLLKKFFYEFLTKKNKIVISGARTYYLLALSFVSLFQKKIEVHLHGQFFGAANNKIKRYKADYQRRHNKIKIFI